MYYLLINMNTSSSSKHAIPSSCPKTMKPITSHPLHQLITIAINSTSPTTVVTDHHHDHSDHHCLSVASHCIIPILARFHAGYFRISLSLGSQALLWRSLIEPTGHNMTLNPIGSVHHFFPRVHRAVFISLWSFALLNLTILSLLYLLRCFFLLHLVKAEFLHHVGVNYLFAPWISWLLLLQCAPGIHSGMEPYLGLWWIQVLPMVILDLKIYGQWFTTEGLKHRLTVVANPTCQMTVIGNLVGSRAAAQMGYKETAMFMFSIGMVHYLVLFITLYQSRDSLPDVLKPVCCLFFAAPSMASLAWSSIAESFDTLAKMLFFLSLFLFMSLVGRASTLNRGMKRFNVAWWAYPFPVTVLALAATEYAEEAKGNTVADVLMLLLVSFSVSITLFMVVFTLFNYSTSSCLLPHATADDHDHDHDGDADDDHGFMMINSSTNSCVSHNQLSVSSALEMEMGQQLWKNSPLKKEKF